MSVITAMAHNLRLELHARGILSLGRADCGGDHRGRRGEHGQTGEGCRDQNLPADRPGGRWTAVSYARWFESGQGHQAENTNRNNNLSHWFDSIFLKKFSSFVESADKKIAPAVQFVGIFVGIGKLNDRG